MSSPDKGTYRRRKAARGPSLSPVIGKPQPSATRRRRSNCSPIADTRRSARVRSGSKTERLPIPDKFETFECAKDRRQTLIRILEPKRATARVVSEHTPYRNLARKLRRCRRGRRCKSGACPVCLRRRRLQLLWEVPAILDRRLERWSFVTLIPANCKAPVGELHQLDLEVLKKRIYKQLRRRLPEVVGCLGFDFSVNEGKDGRPFWQVHLHGVLSSRAPIAAEVLNEVFQGEPTAKRPFQGKKVPDPPGAITYTLKGTFYRWSNYVLDGVERRSRYCLKNEHMRELMLYLDRYGFGARLIIRKN